MFYRSGEFTAVHAERREDLCLPHPGHGAQRAQSQGAVPPEQDPREGPPTPHRTLSAFRTCQKTSTGELDTLVSAMLFRVCPAGNFRSGAEKPEAFLLCPFQVSTQRTCQKTSTGQLGILVSSLFRHVVVESTPDLSCWAFQKCGTAKQSRGIVVVELE